MFIDVQCIFIDSHGFSRVFIDFYGFSMIFKENGASVGRPSAPWRWVFMPKNCCFAWGFLQKQDQCPDPIGSLRRPSAPIGAHRRPSAPAGWELRSRTGLPPQTPPDFLFVIYKVEVVGVVYCSHTPEESADKNQYFLLIV